MLKLTISRMCATSSGKILRSGDIVKYLGHVPGGGVLIRVGGKESIISDNCTKELS